MELNSQSTIYLDYASTTPIDKRVADKLKAIGDGQVMFKCNCTRKVRSYKWVLKCQLCDY